MLNNVLTESTHNIEKATQMLGITLSESDLEILKSGSILSLSSKNLAEIGTALILAQSIASIRSVKNSYSLQDLINEDTLSSDVTGLPIFCWSYQDCEYCLVFVIHGKIPALTCCTRSRIRQNL
jgi:hypothetical protein